ncbi:MAG: rRNA maturation RNase YbeY [Balneolaceae bacterium]
MSEPPYQALEGELFPEIHNPTDLNVPLDHSVMREILLEIEKSEQIQFAFLEVVCVEEEEILRINREYLGHDHVTDTITFRHDDDNGSQHLEGSLFLCLSRIIEQSKEFDTIYINEFCRVYIHSLLHLAGYEDKIETDREEMKKREEYYLARFANKLE